MALEQQIIELLKANEPLKAGEIADKLSVDKADVDKAIKNLKKTEEIVSPKRCFYAAK